MHDAFVFRPSDEDRTSCIVSTVIQPAYRGILYGYFPTSARDSGVWRIWMYLLISNQIMNYWQRAGDLTFSEGPPRITNSNAKLGGVEKIVHCGACEVTVTSLHVPPTHLRIVQVVAKLQGLAVSL